ncbi:hypothetical protein [Clostridium sp. B9]|uniref:hypothetical protein n=1 Tax=Clostridium sp. B9 TaxID=3423224 RepID=UPI003D2EAC8E
MSKRRHKNKGNQSQNQGNPMGGLNPQMLDMLGLGNVDMSKVSEVLSSMGNDGFDMNSINSILNNQDGKGGASNKGTNNTNPLGAMNNQGVNPLAAMLGGGGNPMGGGTPDLSSLMGMLGGGGTGGMNPMGAMGGGMGGLGALANMFGGLGGGDNSGGNSMNNEGSMDPIVTMLVSLKNFVDPQKARFLDKVLTMYKEGKITY